MPRITTAHDFLNAVMHTVRQIQDGRVEEDNLAICKFVEKHDWTTSNQEDCTIFEFEDGSNIISSLEAILLCTDKHLKIRHELTRKGGKR